MAVKNYISNKDETVRMFENDLLEALSHVHWTVPLWLYIPVVLAFVYRTFFVFHLSFGIFILYFAVGIAVWTLTEYSLHRFIFHYPAKSKIGKKLHFIFHGVHHDYPNDTKRLVMPPSVSIPLAIIFYILFFNIFGVELVSPFFAGFLTGYIFYDTTHYAVHHFSIKNKFWLAIKKHHMLHHYKHADKGFGVSQPAWDYILGTTFPDRKRKNSSE